MLLIVTHRWPSRAVRVRRQPGRLRRRRRRSLRL